MINKQAKAWYKKAVESYESSLKIKYCSTAIAMNPEYVAAYLLRGFAYLIQKSPVPAIDDFYNAGMLFLYQRDRDSALGCLETMKDVDPSSLQIQKLHDKIYKEKRK